MSAAMDSSESTAGDGERSPRPEAKEAEEREQEQELASEEGRQRAMDNDENAEAGSQLEPQQVDKEAKEDKPNRFHAALRMSALVSLLAFAAIWGVLTRLGLIALNTYSGQSVTPVIWAQAVGCLVMGWALANRTALEVWYAPLYVAITTGYCGSVTTFSTWIVEVFQAFGNQEHWDRHGLHNVMDALTQTAVTLGMSLASLAAGKALGSTVLRVDPLLERLRRRQKPSCEDKEKARQSHPSLAADVVALLVGIIFWAAAAILCGTYAPFRKVTFSIVLGPPGAILRWYLSRFNSHPRSKSRPYWPLGTLAANLLATAVLCAVFVGQRVGRVSGRGGGGAYSIDGCHALYGVEEGFCGCLSTISTFAQELATLKPSRRAVSYAVASWTFGILLCILLIGAPWWSIGMDGSCVGVTL